MQLKKINELIKNPSKLSNIFLRSYNNFRKKKLWNLFDEALPSNEKILRNKQGETILIEGLWDNPNQFFRLSLFLDALTKSENKNVIALLKNNTDRAKKTLISMGIKDFIYLSDTPKNYEDFSSSLNLLKNIKSHNDFLKFKLPFDFPPHIFYDTALKLEKVAQPNLNSEVWHNSLSDVFRLARFYKKLFSERKITSIILSHPWKNEFGMALTMGFKHKIKCYCLYGVYEMMRIRRYKNFDDLIKSPHESISLKEFSILNNSTRKSIEEAGKNYLETRSEGKNSDLNEQKAYSKKQSGEQLLLELGISDKKPIVTVFCHAWYDFPHIYGMKNFSDFLDWINLTYKIALENKSVTWIFKPHPTETWYGGFFLKNLIKKDSKHIFVVDEQTSVNTILDITDSIVTVHGTIGIEAAAKGIPVLAADQSYYSCWNFVETAKNRAEYIEKLKNIGKKKILSKEIIGAARAFAYLTIAPAEEEINIERLIADHTEPNRMFNDLINICKNKKEILASQSELIRNWINSETNNFCIYHKINFHKVKSSQDKFMETI